MAHTLFRLTESLFSKPLLMTQDSCSEVLSYLDFRNTSSMAQLTSLAINADKVAGKQTALSENGVGTINILGPISTNKTGFEALCNNTSHEGIVEQAEELFADDSVDTVLLNIRSGGGQAHKTFESAMRLKELSQHTGKRLITYIDEMACSAAYAYAVAADEVVINPTATAGSIGVLLQMVNDSKALEKEGYERIFITSSDGKVPYAKDGSFREEFLAEMQESVSELFEGFISHVATLRDINPETVRKSNAGVYSADKAKELGLVDSIMTTHQFYEYLASSSSDVMYGKHDDDLARGRNFTNISTEEIKPTQSVEDTMTNKENLTTEAAPTASTTATTSATPDMAAQLATMQAAMDEQAKQLATYQAAETSAKTAELTETVSGVMSFSNQEAIVSTMQFDSNMNTLLSTMLTEFSTELSTRQAEFETKLSEMTTELESVKETALAEVDTAKAEAQAVKEDFSKPQAIEGDNTSIEDKEAGTKKSSALAQFITENKIK